MMTSGGRASTVARFPASGTSHRAGSRGLPLIHRLASLAAIAAAGPPLYVRYSEGPDADRDGRSVDTESGLELPGLSVNPLQPEQWWTRPLEDWLARQICQYAELRRKNPERIAWVLTGRVVGRGPDCEPLIADTVPMGALSPSLLDEADEIYTRRFHAGHGPED